MKNLKKDKRKIRIIIYTITVLFAIAFSSYPKTNTLFKKDNDNVLAYESTLADLMKPSFKVTPLLAESTIEKLILQISFSKDERYNSNDYLFEMDNIKGATCNFVESIITENGAFKFSDGETEATIKIECNIEKDKDINLDVKLYEIIKNEGSADEKFLYRDGNYNEKWNVFETLFPIYPEDGVIVKDITGKDEDYIYNAFLGIMEKYVQEESEKTSSYISKYKSVELVAESEKRYITDPYFYRSYFNNFIKENSNNELNKTNANMIRLLFDDNELAKLFGVSKQEAQNSEGKDGYRFGFDENFVGYVIEDYIASIGGTLVIYYSTEKASLLDIAVDNTIDKWLFNNSDNFLDSKITIKDLVKEYIKSYINDNFVNKKYTLNNLSNIPGIMNLTFQSDFPCLDLEEAIPNYAYNYAIKDQNIMKIAHISYSYNTETYKANVFRYGIPNIVSDKTISDKIIKYIYDEPYTEYNDNDLYKAIICEENCNTLKNEFKFDNYTLTINFKEGYNEVSVKSNSTPTPVLENGFYYDTIEQKYTFVANNTVSASSSTIDDPLKQYLNNDTIAEAIIKNLNNTDIMSKITCTTDCNNFKEVHYNGKYILFEITPKENKNNIEISVKDDIDFKNVYPNIDASLLEKIFDASAVEKIKDTSQGAKIEDIYYSTGDSNYYQLNIENSKSSYNVIKLAKSTDIIEIAKNTYDTIDLSIITTAFNAIKNTVEGDQEPANLNNIYYYEDSESKTAYYKVDVVNNETFKLINLVKSEDFTDILNIKSDENLITNKYSDEIINSLKESYIGQGIIKEIKTLNIENETLFEIHLDKNNDYYLFKIEHQGKTNILNGQILDFKNNSSVLTEFINYIGKYDNEGTIRTQIPILSSDKINSELITNLKKSLTDEFTNYEIEIKYRKNTENNGYEKGMILISITGTEEQPTSETNPQENPEVQIEDKSTTEPDIKDNLEDQTPPELPSDESPENNEQTEDDNIMPSDAPTPLEEAPELELNESPIENDTMPQMIETIPETTIDVME